MIQSLRHRHMHRHLVPFQTPLMPQTSIHMGLSSLRGIPHLEQILEARPQGKSNDVNVCVWAPDLRHVWKGYQNKCTSFSQDRFQHYCNDCSQHEGADVFKEEMERLLFSAVWSTDYQFKQQAPFFFFSYFLQLSVTVCRFNSQHACPLLFTFQFYREQERFWSTLHLPPCTYWKMCSLFALSAIQDSARPEPQ